MRQLTIFLTGVAGVAIAVLAGNLWWVLWMNHGWFGPPGLIAKVLGVDGEAAYDAILLEMILIIAAILAIGVICYRFYPRERKSP